MVAVESPLKKLKKLNCFPSNLISILNCDDEADEVYQPNYP